jgi:hypothetical protein
MVLGAIYSPSKDLDLDIGFRAATTRRIERAVMAGLRCAGKSLQVVLEAHAARS